MTAGSVAVPTIVPLRPPGSDFRKNVVDYTVKFELASDTPDVVIFYTTNGFKPEPFGAHGPEVRSTMKYVEPFTLAPGRRTIKALALTRDNRMSNVVTKTFEVEGPEFTEQLHEQQQQQQQERLRQTSRADGYGFIQDIPPTESAQREVRKFANTMTDSRTAWAEMSRGRSMNSVRTNVRSTSANRSMTDSARRPRTTEDVHNAHPTVPKVTGEDGRLLPSSQWSVPLAAMQALKLQRETDFLRCINCFATRPSDPYARFCTDCGHAVPALPQTRIPPPEPGDMGTCVYCKARVPLNTPFCLVCESPLPPQHQPQASVRLTDKLLCVVCGTANPSNLTSCITCQAKLVPPNKALFPTSQAPAMQPTSRSDYGGQVLACTKCGRLNSSDARFCDWCGAKTQYEGYVSVPSLTLSSLTCAQCGATNNAYAKFCASCGLTVAPPLRSGINLSGASSRMGNGSATGDAEWMPYRLPLNPVAKCDMATQTVGLFYPSQKDIQRKQDTDANATALEQQIRDRRPPLTAISPGRGYWRKQMDHICMHLKAQAQNDAEFRALIAEPRMGKILSTVVHEDAYELALTVSFALKDTKDPLTDTNGRGMKRSDYLSSYTVGSKSSVNSYMSDDVDSEDTARSASMNNKKNIQRSKKKKKPITKKPPIDDDKMSAKDRKLLKELGKNAEGRPSEIQQLIEEGADPKCEDKDGYPMLHVAVLNRHADAIPVLVGEGAEVNRKGPNKGYTALHEAVAADTTTDDIINVLLGCGANPQVKNDRGENAIELAVKLGRQNIANKLTAHVGEKAIGKLTKPSATHSDEDV